MGIQQQINDHINDRDNPHNLDKDKIGLDKVQNYPLASEEEARAGEAVNRYLTVKTAHDLIDEILYGWGITDKDGNLLEQPPIPDESYFPYPEAEDGSTYKPPIWETGASLGTWEGEVDEKLEATSISGFPVNYRVVSGSLPDGVSLSNDGTLSGEAPYSDNEYEFEVAASDGLRETTRTFVANTLPPEPPVWSYGSDPHDLGSVFGNVSIQLSASDPQGLSLTYTLLGGNLPSSLTVDSDGELRGSTPEDGGNASFTVRASNGTTYDDHSFTLHMQAVQPPSWNTGSNLGTWEEDVDVQLSASDPQGLSLSYSIVGGSLPSGVGMNSNGRITGTAPYSDSNYSFTVRASNGSRSSDRTFNVSTPEEVDPPVWQTTAVYVYRRGTFDTQLEASDPQGLSLTFSMAQGTLPGGLELTSDGRIVGEKGTTGPSFYDFSIRVSNGTSSATRRFEYRNGDTSYTDL